LELLPGFLVLLHADLCTQTANSSTRPMPAVDCPTTLRVTFRGRWLSKPPYLREQSVEDGLTPLVAAQQFLETQASTWSVTGPGSSWTPDHVHNRVVTPYRESSGGDSHRSFSPASMPARHRHQHSSKRRKAFTIMLESC
jgi:hypothetical protein